MTFREIVQREFARRRKHDTRYSLRRFARQLGVHHTTVSRLVRGATPVPERTVRGIGSRLGLTREEIEVIVLGENESAILEAIRLPMFRPSSRWLASTSGISVDNVNVALQALLRQGILSMVACDRWLFNRRG